MKFDLRPSAVLRRLVVAYLLICLFMLGYQRHLMYLPETDIKRPRDYGLAEVKVVPLTSSDGTHVQAWYHRAAPGYPTIIYFHGNGGHMGGRARYFQLLTQDGFGLLALDYRGYGASEGSPSEEGFYEDAHAAIDYCLKTLSLRPDQIIMYGESIGTGVAVQMATEYPFEALVLQSPFTSLVARGQDLYYWLPVSLLEIDRFDSLSKIGHIHSPLLLFHGEKDDIVPVTDGRAVFAQAPEPKEAVYYPDKGHVDLDINQMSRSLMTFSHKYHLIKPDSDAH